MQLTNILMLLQWALRITAFIEIGLLVIAIALISIPQSARKAARTGSTFESLLYFKDVKFILLYLASAIMIFGFMVPPFYLPTYIEVVSGASANTGSSLSATYNAGSILGRLCVGLLGDTRLGRFNVVLTCMILSGTFQLVFWLPAHGNIGLTFAFAALEGFVSGGYIGLLPVVLAQIFPSEKL